MNYNQSSVNSTRSSNQNKDSSQILKPKSSCSPKPQFSKPLANSKVFKVENKFASEPKITLKEYEAKLKKGGKRVFKKNGSKIKRIYSTKI